MKSHLFESKSRRVRAANLRTAAHENELAGFPGFASVCRQLANWLDPPQVKLTSTVEKPARRKGPAVAAPQVTPAPATPKPQAPPASYRRRERVVRANQRGADGPMNPVLKRRGAS